MKKKIFFAIATVFFAVATVFNMNKLESTSAGNVSLEGIVSLAQASPENDNSKNDQAEGTKEVTVTTCVEFNYVFFKCSREKTVKTIVPCCVDGTSTCKSSIPC